MIGVVIVNYNRGSLILKLLEDIEKYKSISKIIIVDSASSDDSIQLLSEYKSEKVDLVFYTHNIGYASGNNVGLKKLYNEYGCDIAFVVNPDVYFDEEVILELKKIMENNNEYAVVSCKRFDPDTSKRQLQYSKKPFNTFPLLVASNLQVFRHILIRYIYGVYEIESESKKVFEAGELPGSFLGFNLKLCNTFGFFDEGTFLYSEEMILATCVMRAGYKEGFVPWICYEHRHVKNSTTNIHSYTTPLKHSLASKEYYQNKYLNLNKLQLICLHISERIALFEGAIIQKIRNRS